jgi:hypothetical protein
MIKERLRIGMVVKTNKGLIGMIVAIRTNLNVYLNSGHYHTCTMMYPDYEPSRIREMVLSLGTDQDVMDKSEFVEIVTKKYCK